MPPINLKNALTRHVRIAALTESQVFALENGNRVGLMVYNDSVESTLYLAVDRDATTELFTVRLRPGSLYEMPFEYFTAKVTGIWDDAEGYAQITEISDK